MPCSLKRNPFPFLEVFSTFHLFRLDPFRSSYGPLVHRSPFHISYVFPFNNPQPLRNRYTAPALHPVSPFYIVRFSISFSHWFSVVVAYPEPYIELRFPLRSVLYKVTQPLNCSLASSTQSSLVSSLPRFALRSSLIEAFPHPEQLSWDVVTLHEILPRIHQSTRTLSGRRLLKDTPCVSKITGPTLSTRTRLEITLKTLPVYKRKLPTRL